MLLCCVEQVLFFRMFLHVSCWSFWKFPIDDIGLHFWCNVHSEVFVEKIYKYVSTSSFFCSGIPNTRTLFLLVYCFSLLSSRLHDNTMLEIISFKSTRSQAFCTKTAKLGSAKQPSMRVRNFLAQRKPHVKYDYYYNLRLIASTWLLRIGGARRITNGFTCDSCQHPQLVLGEDAARSSAVSWSGFTLQLLRQTNKSQLLRIDVAVIRWDNMWTLRAYIHRIGREEHHLLEVSHNLWFCVHTIIFRCVTVNVINSEIINNCRKNYR